MDSADACQIVLRWELLQGGQGELHARLTKQSQSLNWRSVGSATCRTGCVYMDGPAQEGDVAHEIALILAVLWPRRLDHLLEDIKEAWSAGVARVVHESPHVSDCAARALACS